jgi:hypothetical protein
MRSRAKTESPSDIDGLLDVLCDPDVPPERQAEARRIAFDAFGPAADGLLRAATRTAAAQRELSCTREQLERMLGGGAQLRGIVTAVQNGRVCLQIGPTERVLVRPADMTLGIGQIVYTDAGAQTVIGAGEYLIGGSAYAVCERLDGRHVLVRPLREAGQEEARLLGIVADSVDLDTLAFEDRVLGYGGLALGNVVLVTRRLGPAQRPAAPEIGVPRPVRREDIVGLDDVIERLERLFLTPPSPAYAALLGEAERAAAGAVLCGPPGCGKSLLADYFVDRTRASGGTALVRTASSFLSKWVGEGAARLRADFMTLDRAWEESGVRPLLVIDELEAIALDRSQGFMLHGGYLDVLDTLLALLTRSQARLIGISNLADRYLDTALTRDGRLPIVQLPHTLDAAQVATLVAKSLTRIPLASPEETRKPAHDRLSREFGEAVSDLVFAPNGTLAELLRVQLADGRMLSFGARDLATAAAIADGIVRPLLARLAQRDLRAGREEPCPLALDDLTAATTGYFIERCRSITRDNVRSVLAGRLPEDQALTKVEHTAQGGSPR